MYTKAFILNLLILTLVLPIQTGSAFAENKYQQEINSAISAGLISTNSTEATNKCEALLIMEKAFSWQVDKSQTTDQFTDTPLWCKPYANFAAKNQVITGNNPTELGFNKKLTRGEIATMLYREAQRQNYPSQDIEYKFKDAIPQWARKAINSLVSLDVIKGFADNTFQAEQPVLKKDLAILINRLKNSSKTQTPAWGTYLGFTMPPATSKQSVILQLNADQERTAIFTKTNLDNNEKTVFEGTWYQEKNIENLIVAKLKTENSKPLTTELILKFINSSDTIVLKEKNLEYGPRGLILAKNDLNLNSDWLWIETKRGKEVVAKAEDSKQPFNLTFSATGNISVSGDCNGMGAGYTITEPHMLSFSPIVSTLKYCENSIETQFANSLSKTKGYYLNGNTLTLQLENNKMDQSETMIFHQKIKMN